MKPLYSLFVALVLLALASSASAQKPPAPILLWPNGAPGATGTSDEDKPAIIPVLPSEATNTGAAILVIPGGGFTTRATDFEGVLVAQYFKERGIASFILRYRILPLYSRKDWLLDAQRAMQHLRTNAKQFRIAPNRIGVIGFSAGADLAYDASLNPLSAQPEAADPLERVSSRPDFQVLVYGAAPQRNATEGAGKLADLPPAFMFCTAEDMGHLRGMSALYMDLLQAKVSVESHFFLNGEHGVGIAIGDPVLGQYPTLLMNWIIGNGFLTDKPRVPLTGIVKLDGQPLIRGVVILTPVSQPAAPPVIAYITNAHTRALGSFLVSQNQGPVTGKYRVEVRQNATRWQSNSRDPLMIKMMEKQRTRTLTDDDRKEWGAYIRKRDLSPSIENQRIFRRQHPNDKNDYIVEIKSGGENNLNLEVFSR